ncbi:unnamed protein product [Rhizopus stolonifer]
MSGEKKSLPSLSSLARQKNSSPSPNGSLSQLKQKMQNQAASKPLSPLQSLAQKSTNKPNGNGMPSLASLAQRSAPKANSLSLLSTGNAPSTSKHTGLSKLTSLVQPKVESSIKEQSEEEEQKTEQATYHAEDDSEKGDTDDNPLCAKPSVAAQFLFEQQPQMTLNRKVQFLTSSLHTMFYESIKKSSPIPVFAFDKPSPDDIVFAAQSQRGANKKN